MYEIINFYCLIIKRNLFWVTFLKKFLNFILTT